MHWFWDNIYESKNKRKQYLLLLMAIILFLGLKYAVKHYATTPKYTIDPTVLDSIKMVALKPYKFEKKKVKDSSYQVNKLHKERSLPKTKKNKKRQMNPKSHTVESFPFDPNKTNKDSLKRLGLSDFAINNLIKYRNAGGIIKSEEHFGKIYGIEESTAKRLAPFLQLRKETPSNTIVSRTPQKKYKKKVNRPIEINAADTSAWKEMIGIGSFRAKTIVEERDKMGGFMSISQVRNIWSVPDSLYYSLEPFLQVDKDLIIKQDLNQIDIDQLKAHPYLSPKEAKYIVKYRSQHGSFKNVDELYKLHGLEASLVDTLIHYFQIK